jgi:hypothetical protein
VVSEERWVYFRWLYPADQMAGLPEKAVLNALEGWKEQLAAHPDVDVLISIGPDGWTIEGLTDAPLIARRDAGLSK